MILSQLTRHWTSTVLANGLPARGNLGAWKRAAAVGVLVVGAAQAHARTSFGIADALGGRPSTSMTSVLQCVPYARSTSGIRLFGDAHTWWGQAKGKYDRGRSPRPGAVMAMQPHGGSTLGHVATVTRVLGTRTILISHANWSAPGMIERNVTAVDVSATNDWSEVRVWFAPIRNLGGARWPVSGFIYRDRPIRHSTLAYQAKTTLAKRALVESATWPAGSTRQLKRTGRIDAHRDPIGAIIAGSY